MIAGTRVLINDTARDWMAPYDAQVGIAMGMQGWRNCELFTVYRGKDFTNPYTGSFVLRRKTTKNYLYSLKRIFYE